MSKIILLAIIVAIIWFWWRRQGASLPHVKNMDRAGAAALLGIRPDADAETVKAAWRAKIAESHPDRGGDAEKVIEITRARDLLLRGDDKRIGDKRNGR